MRVLFEIADFFRMQQRQMRFGDLSRAHLRLLRLEWRCDAAECDWMVRPSDPWDASLPYHQRERRVAEQALRDAISVRDLIFSELPGVNTATLRAFRMPALCEPAESAGGVSAKGPPELVIAGTVRRERQGLPRIRSIAMRVKLCGLQFHLDDGRLGPLQRGAE